MVVRIRGETFMSNLTSLPWNRNTLQNHSTHCSNDTNFRGVTILDWMNFQHHYTAILQHCTRVMLVQLFHDHIPIMAIHAFSTLQSIWLDFACGTLFGEGGYYNNNSGNKSACNLIKATPIEHSSPTSYQ